jgi:signal transduction histidine kinase
MRERVVSTGGTFDAGRAEGGGFQVRAEWAAPAGRVVPA